MPVFGNQNKRPQRSQPKQDIPAWMQGNNASQYVSPNVGQGQQGTQFTPGYGQDTIMSGSGTRRRGRGATANGIQLDRPTAAPQTMSGTGTVRRGRGAPGNGIQLDSPQAQTYVANPQTYTAPTNTPAWLPATNNPFTPNAGLTLQSQAPMMPGQQVQNKKDEKPWRIQNADGTWAYLQNDGSYLTNNGEIAGQTHMPTLHNNVAWMPPLLQLQPQNTPTTGYNGFGSTYRGWGGRGGGGRGGSGGSSYSPNAPAWYMNLNSWNYGE